MSQTITLTLTQEEADVVRAALWKYGVENVGYKRGVIASKIRQELDK